MLSALGGWWARWRGRAAVACPARQEIRRIASRPGGGLPTPTLRAWLQRYNWQGQRLSADEA
eukprot:9214552-Lingulodinium_polyedra.AAC.1